jgi:hypothetical protein
MEIIANETGLVENLLSVNKHLLTTSKNILVINPIFHPFTSWGAIVDTSISHHFANNDNWIIIVDTSSECYYEENIKKLCEKYKNLFFVDGGSVAVHAKNISAECSLTKANKFDEQYKNYFVEYAHRDKHFVSLNRNVRPDRILLINDVSRYYLLDYGIITFGGGSLDDLSWVLLCDPILQPKMPMLLNSDANTDYKTLLPGGNAFFNLVSESSNNLTVNWGWDRIFITEKTIKVFFKKQIPIFFTVPGHVAYLRSLGFDVFDDVINHSYDLVQDPHDRVRLIVLELLKVCNVVLPVWVAFFTKHNARFENNKNLCIDLSNKILNKTQQKIINVVNHGVQ